MVVLVYILIYVYYICMHVFILYDRVRCVLYALRQDREGKRTVCLVVRIKINIVVKLSVN